MKHAKSNKHQHIKNQLIKTSCIQDIFKIHTNPLNKKSKLDEKKDQSEKQKEN